MRYIKLFEEIWLGSLVKIKDINVNNKFRNTHLKNPSAIFRVTGVGPINEVTINDINDNNNYGWAYLYSLELATELDIDTSKYNL